MTTSKKRKSDSSLFPLSSSSSPSKKAKKSSASNATKKPRVTLDNFFAPKISVSVIPNVGIDGVASAGKGDKGKGQGGMKVDLSVEQWNVLRMVVDEGRSVFFTGSAGELWLFYLLVSLLVVARHSKS